MPGASYLVDTNILLRLAQPDSPEHGSIRQCTDVLWAKGANLFYTSQNLAEFWNVCTRPTDRNGFGFSISEADERASLIEAQLNFAADNEATHWEWRRIVVTQGVSGVQVHDARLVARCTSIGSTISSRLTCKISVDIVALWPSLRGVCSRRSRSR